MKQITDFTQRELAEMSDEAFDLLVEREAMTKGLAKPAELPAISECPPYPQACTGTATVWLVSVGSDYHGARFVGTAFGSEAGAKEVADAITKHGIGRYETGPYTTPSWQPEKIDTTMVCKATIPDPTQERVWKAQNSAATAAIDRWKSDREEVANQIEKYNKFVSDMQNLKDAAKYAKIAVDRILAERSRFIELSEGNVEVAERFLEQRHPDFRATLREWNSPSPAPAAQF